MKAEQIGIIDMGSNSIRFVVYDINEKACYKEIQNLKVVARLSSYITKEGIMSKEGIDIIIKTLHKFEEVLADYSISRVKGVATAAIRNSKNKQEILKAMRKYSNFDIKILSEEEEAYYGYLAVTNSTQLEEGITIDIGGGSTEITYFKDRLLQHSHSFPFGAITLKNQFVAGSTPTKEEWTKLTSFLKESYSSLPWLQDKSVPVIGIGGSARNLALVHQNIISYPLSGLHQYQMSTVDVTSVQSKLSGLPLSKREKVDGLSKDRADIILPAIAAIEELLYHVRADEFVVSNKGLRDGIFYKLFLEPLNTSHFQNVTEENFYQLSINYSLNITKHKNIAVLSSFLVHELLHHELISLTSEDLDLMKWSAKVFYIGSSIHPEAKSQHTFYLLTNQAIDGLSHMDRLAVAFISSFQSKSSLKQFAKPFSDWINKEEISKYELLGAILKFSHGLNASDRNVIKKIKVSFVHKRTIGLNIFHTDDPFFEEFNATKYKKHLERVLNKSIQLTFVPI
ncbi:phosphatase [Salipaludibacillus neizhouensis]|uniref:Phosphatase n=2 Tax=Salipaludibacillus neizhouensis TaxID=885475 RepID=A0A3A9KD74_9BACI|nr:Ppx/GppA family phosphatase [Salipaludibacillus neizhouensis]RKL68700.1 phosphatase [Salipaludibacillus neizhouensis]